MGLYLLKSISIRFTGELPLKKAVMSILFFILTVISWPMKEMGPLQSYKKYSSNKKYFFKMHPRVDGTGYGAMYKVNLLIPNKLFWEVDGWYAHDVYISYDGNYLVRMGYSYYGRFDPKEFALGFYKQGKLLQRYLNGSLIKDKSLFNNKYSVRGSCCLDKIYGFQGEKSYIFKILTMDQITYLFDVRTGLLKNATKN